ncbi:TraB/GumN family protein [Flavisolibacter sp. BT320]|nr:TraB/GumN family protein [Flavisolibacter longurius]
MKNLLCACVFAFLTLASASQPTQLKADKYPSLLWEISGKGLKKPSYLFGTMHVSNKMVFHLSDSFYLGIKNAQVVALETDPGNWQEDFSKYDLEGETMRYNLGRYFSKGYSNTPQDYLTINSLQLHPFEKWLEVALYSNPAIINSFLYRNNTESGSDFEEDTYLDLHIYQAGRKLGKKVCGVEDFHGSMKLVREAYADAAKEKKRSRNFDHDDEFSYARMEEAYRTGNLDLLDTINKVNSQSAAFDEKFLYKRNDIQAASIDSILKTGATLFAGVGAAHLPGERGVIEILRKEGYTLRPIRMKERDSQHKESIERMRVPVQFARQAAEDGFYSVKVPGKLYSFGSGGGALDMKQYADMTNGSYYMVTRIVTNAAMLGISEAEVQRKLDSILYVNIPGKILSKKSILRNGYQGYDIANRTRRGDHQRYNIFITPFEVLVFKMSGNGEYVRLGTEAEQFFSSIQLSEQKPDWRPWSPSYGGFEALFPHRPMVLMNGNRIYAAYDQGSGTTVEVVCTDVHNYDFAEEDSFDLQLMEESFAASESIARNLSKKWTNVGGYKALDAAYRYKDSSVARVRFLVRGPHYYSVMAHAKKENRLMSEFIGSFAVKPFVYGEARPLTDTLLKYSVTSPFALEKERKLVMYPEEAYYTGSADDSLVDNGTFLSRIIENDSTGEKVYVSYYKHSPYYFKKEDSKKEEADLIGKDWIVRWQKKDSLANGLIVREYELGQKGSSRVLRGKEIGRDAMGYKLLTQGDTLSAPSSFLTNFFSSFSPQETFRDLDIRRKKTGLFFEQFFSADTVAHKKAIMNVLSVKMDASDFPQLKKSIESLNWNEKAYLETKKTFIGKLASLRSDEAADYLKTLYFTAGDTVELQFTALETLLRQRTSYAYNLFGQIMQNDPPVLTVSNNNSGNRNYDWGNGEDDEEDLANGAFIDNLYDSLELTASIFPALLPLINIDDYERPVMALMGRLVDSSLLVPAAYEAYLPKFLLEAKQDLKKQMIREKSRAIEKLKKEEDAEIESRYDREEDDFGNSKLSLYATLILPFREQSPQVAPILQGLLQSSDKKLKYNTTVLLLRNNIKVPDSLLTYFASRDEFRSRLYDDLAKMGQTDKFPLLYKTQQLHAQSKLVAYKTYGRPDTLVYLDKLPMQDKDLDGLLYFFKYKEKKDDNAWKLAIAGLYPKDSTVLVLPMEGDEDEAETDFTRLTGTKLSADTPLREQLEKMVKKLLYSRRNSASQFYEENGYDDMDVTTVRYR